MPVLDNVSSTMSLSVVAGTRLDDRSPWVAHATVRMLRGSPWLLTISRTLGAVVVTVDGSLDTRTAAVLGDALSDLIDGQGNLLVVVDVRRMVVADPEALQVLIDARRSLESREGRFLLAAPSPATALVLRAGGLGAVIELHPERRHHPSSA